MPIEEEYSLVRYDPRQSLMGLKTQGLMRPASGRASTPHPYQDAVAACRAEGPLGKGQPHLIYSFRRTVETPPGGAIGRIVDIFV